MTNPNYIQFIDVQKTNGKTTVANSLSFSIPQNSVVYISGASGSGKSTLLHMLCGFVNPKSGEIQIDGRVVNNPKPIIAAHERGINMLFQDLALWPHMTAYEQLEFVGGNNKDVIESICTKLHFPSEYLSKYPSQLSGGEQQRLALARTFIAPKPILLLDEPYTALDHKLRDVLTEFLIELKNQNETTIIIVSHDLMVKTLNPDLEFHLEDGIITNDSYQNTSHLAV